MKTVMSLLLLALLSLVVTSGPVSEGRTASSRSKLYVDNAEGDELTIIDPVTFKVTGNVKVGENPHGLAASPRQDRLYVSVEGIDSLLSIDTRTDQILGKASVGSLPNQVTVTADGKFVYVPLRGLGAVDIVDTASMKAIKRVPLAAWPHNSYTSANGKHVYVTTILGMKIFVFDPTTHTITAEIEPGGKVRPVALTKDESLAYVALSELHGFAIVDLKTRKTIRRVELPALPPDTPKPYLDTYTHGLALTSDEKELWVTSCPGAAVYAYSLPDLTLKARVDVGKFPNWMAFTPDGKTLFVSNTQSNTVSAIDVKSKKLVATIPVGKAPKRILVVTPPENGRP